MTQTVYSEENLKVLLFYVIIPLIVIYIIFYIGLKIYEHRNKKKDSNRVNFVMNYWSTAIAILFTAILLSISIGFSLAFTENVRELNAVDENLMLYYFFIDLLIIRLFFLTLN